MVRSPHLAEPPKSTHFSTSLQLGVSPIAPCPVKSIARLPQGALAPVRGGCGRGGTLARKAEPQRLGAQARDGWAKQEKGLVVSPNPTLPSCAAWGPCLHLSQPPFPPL